MWRTKELKLRDGAKRELSHQLLEAVSRIGLTEELSAQFWTWNRCEKARDGTEHGLSSGVLGGGGQRGDGRHVPAGVSGGAAAQGFQEGDSRRACHGVPHGHHPRALYPAAAALPGPTGHVGRPQYVTTRSWIGFCFFLWELYLMEKFYAHTGWAPDRPSSPDGAPAYPNPPRPPSPPMQTVTSLLSGPLFTPPPPPPAPQMLVQTLCGKGRRQHLCLTPPAPLRSPPLPVGMVRPYAALYGAALQSVAGGTFLLVWKAARRFA